MTGFAEDRIDDDMLMALADDELSRDQAAGLRARIAADPALAERFSLFAETRALLGAEDGRADAADDPAVARIAAAIRAADMSAAAPSAPERRFTLLEGGASSAPPAAAKPVGRPPMRFRVAAPAIAASLALVVGGLLGYGVGRQGGAGPDQTQSVIAAASAPAAAAAAIRALDGSASGRPVAWNNASSGLKGTVAVLSSHKVEDGRFCREYAVSVDGVAERAVALGCRDAGSGAWRTELLALAPGGDGYAKTSGETIAETALTELGSVGAMSEEEEAAAIKGGWSNPGK